MALVGGNYTQLSDTGYTRSDLVAFFDRIAAKYGVSVDNGDVDALAAKLMGESEYIREMGGDPQLAFDAFESQYARRGANTPGVGPSSEELQAETATVDPIRPARTTAPAASTAVTVASPSAATTPSVGPTGLANPNLPVNYATGAIGSQYGYGGVGGVMPATTTASGGLFGGGMSTWLLLGGAALAIYFLVVKK